MDYGINYGATEAESITEALAKELTSYETRVLI